jgi:hypothetical protein
MSAHRILAGPGELTRLANILARSAKVRTFDSEGEQEAPRLAYSLGDIEESATTLLQLLSSLTDEKLAAAEIEDLLQQIGEEFRHILYHMRDPKYFRYLFNDPELGS